MPENIEKRVREEKKPGNTRKIRRICEDLVHYFSNVCYNGDVNKNAVHRAMPVTDLELRAGEVHCRDFLFSKS